MSVSDMIKKSVLNSFSQYNVPKMALALLVALLVGIVIYCVYRRFYTGVVYSRSFAVTLVGMCVLTCMVTLAISTNIVISLGMVGALSIVRYRTAVKDPMDLLYLFWAITSGIAAGAGMYLLVVVAGAVMIGMLALFYSHQDKGPRVHRGDPLRFRRGRGRHHARVRPHEVLRQIQNHAWRPCGDGRGSVLRRQGHDVRRADSYHRGC